jgi:hypothetical protein
MLNWEMNLLKAAMHPVIFWTSLRIWGGFILVIDDTFSGLGPISRRETIYPSNFPESTPNVHLSGFSFSLNFFPVVKGLYQVRDESFIFTTMSSTYASVLHLT